MFACMHARTLKCTITLIAGACIVLGSSPHLREDGLQEGAEARVVPLRRDLSTSEGTSRRGLSDLSGKFAKLCGPLLINPRSRQHAKRRVSVLQPYCKSKGRVRRGYPSTGMHGFSAFTPIFLRISKSEVYNGGGRSPGRRARGRSRMCPQAGPPI